VDYSLTPRGLEPARRTADHLARLPIAAVYSSPLKRASETAGAIAARLALPVTVLEQFREIDVGELEGQPPTDERWAFHDSIFERWFAGDPDAAFPGGESQRDICARMREGLRAAVRDRSGEHVVVVAHGGIAVATLANLCPDADIAFIARADIPNCAISTIAVESDGDGDLRCRLVAWAACDHLA
jgi:broad specificity phosphatase PhoE